MKFIKKSLSCLISAAVLCCTLLTVPVSAEEQYVYNNIPTVFDLINIRRSLMNADGEYTMSDYNTMLNFLLKKKATVSKKVSISYDTEGCDTSTYSDLSVLDTYECTSGSIIKVAPSGLIKDGYYHSGWVYDGKVYSTNETFVVPDNDVVFTPFWYNSNIIQYYAGDYDDIIGQKTASFNATEGSTITLAESSRFSRKGYKISGWLCDYDGLIYGTISSYVVPESDVTFTAVWKPATYSIRISANNGNSSDKYTLTATYGEEFIFPECEYENGTKTFAGWQYEDQIYQPGDSTVFPPLLSGESIVIVATWK
ncbi:InlB B-repeat-containing protein [Porcipelethomonas sp.]|uniref:InlB B-repeat-containing protein n=1 Tax=Porcipelethomonas sp. TaxID=2981675 RepID=UPI003EF11878